MGRGGKNKKKQQQNAQTDDGNKRVVIDNGKNKDGRSISNEQPQAKVSYTMEDFDSTTKPL